ncbi:MAG: HAMP domain-containing sensor histidine kinase, partial [Bacteroidota bacterium]
LNIGLAYHSSPLQRLRQRTVNIFNIICILSLLIINAVKYLKGDYTMMSARFLACALFTLSLLLSKKNKLNESVIISAITISLIFIVSNFIDYRFPSRNSPQIGLIIAFFIILIDQKWSRIFYVLLIFVLLTFMSIKFNVEIWAASSYILEDLFFLVAFFLFAEFMDQLDRNLLQALEELEKVNLERKDLNNKLKSKNEELLVFSQMMSHDLKAPLRVINSFSRILRKKLSLENQKDKEYFSYIEKNSKSMKHLIDDLLAFFNTDSENNLNHDVELGKVIEEVIATFQYDIDEKGVQVEIVGIWDIEDLKGNEQLLRTVFHNLISNAIKYQPKDKEGHIPWVKIQAKRSYTETEVWVSDNGIGVEKKHQKNLFQAFQRFHSKEQYKGTGLGLSICKRAMEKLGGEVFLLESSENGSIFKLIFKNSTQLEVGSIKN